MPILRPNELFHFPELSLYEMLLAALAANAFIPATGDPFKV